MVKYRNLDYIRGIAALGVVVYHYFIFFFTNQNFCARLSNFSPIEFFNPILEQVKDFPFDLGQFSVGLFFLLSGFLVPSLVERYPTRKTLFQNRFFRLWPIFAVGLLINILFVLGGSFYTGNELPYSADMIIASFVCLRDIFDYPYITGIVWTF